ncbi:MAG: GNAT family N-acetyltransferase [Dissulfurispiraceae bacterium]
MQASADFIIRDYKTGDEEGITSLFRQVFGQDMTLTQWNWKYGASGKGKMYTKVAEDASKRIIAHVGGIPLRGIFQRSKMHFFQMTDVMVHPEVRGFLGRKNIFDVIMKRSFEDIEREFPNVFCYGFSGTRPFLIGKRLGIYDEVEQALDISTQLRRSLFNPYTVHIMHWHDDRLDSLWDGVSKDISLAVVRDKEYLCWRYDTNPFFTYGLLGFFLFGKLKGWAVIKKSADETLLIDLLTEQQRCGNILKSLCNYLISIGEKKIRFWLPPSWRDTLKGYSFQESGVIVTNVVWKLPLQASVVKDNFYYTMGDVDIF